MKTIDEIRHANLLLLIQQHGKLADLNEKIGLARTDATLSQIKNRNKTSRGNPKSMGDELARRIESELNLDRGWMDNDHTVTYRSNAVATVVEAMESMDAQQQYQVLKVVAALTESLPKAANGD